MNGHVRPSRDEWRRTKSARERETRARLKAAAKGHKASLTDTRRLVSEVMSLDHIGIDAVLTKLVHHHRYSGISEAEFGSTIFDPALVDLRMLPIGLLDEKEEMMPPKFVPDTVEALRAYAKRMILCSSNPEHVDQLVDLLAETWPGTGPGNARFEQHINDMWRLRSSQPLIFVALICGQHGMVVRALRDREYCGATRFQRHDLAHCATRENIVRSLKRQTLLWATHDVQMVMARNALAATAPLGDFIKSTMTVLEPETVVKLARGQRTTTLAMLDAHRAGRASGEDCNPGTAAIFATGPARPVHKQILIEANNRGLDLDAPNRLIDGPVDQAFMCLDQGNGIFLEAVKSTYGATKLPKSFHALWFSGLSNLAASSVPILRYLQLENIVDQLVDNQIAVRGKSREARFSMPVFKAKNLPKTWRARSRDLLLVYRSSLLRDKDLNSLSNDHSGRDEHTGRLPINKAVKFLETRRARRVEDHCGDANNVERTLHLLDVIPEHRIILG